MPTPLTAAGLRGLHVPLVTPFTADDEIDRESLQHLARRVLRQGARGVVALGTTGEPATLTADEQRRVVDVCAAVCDELQRPLVVGVGTNSTRSSVEAARTLGGADGVTAVMVVVPYYTRPAPDAVVEHLRIVASESPVPVVVYNVPYRTGRALSAGHLLELTAHPNVIGVKQAVGAFDADTLLLLRDAPASFAVLAGDDAFIAPTVLLGGSGAIAAAAHVCTAEFAALVDAALAGDALGARTLAARLLPLVQAGFAEPNPAGWKAALHVLGEIATPALRMPMTAMSGPGTVALSAALDALLPARPPAPAAGARADQWPVEEKCW